MRLKKKSVGFDDFSVAIDRTISGLEKNKVPSLEEKALVAHLVSADGGDVPWGRHPQAAAKATEIQIPKATEPSDERVLNTWGTDPYEGAEEPPTAADRMADRKAEHDLANAERKAEHEQMEAGREADRAEAKKKKRAA